MLTAEEEGELAYRGALASVEEPPESVAVCDVGGGSTQVAVGSPDEGPAWARSFDIGSLRLTRRALVRRPAERESGRRARDGGRAAVRGLDAAAAAGRLAAGGSARALGKVVGPQLGAEELAVALQLLGERSLAQAREDVRPLAARARTLPAGTLMLAATQRLLGVPLMVARGGVREGVALSLLAEAAVAA